MALAATSYTDTWKSQPSQLSGDLSPYIDTANGALYLSGAEPLLRMTIGCNFDPVSREPGRTLKTRKGLTAGNCKEGPNRGKSDHWDEIGDSYFVIHLLRWKDVAVDPTNTSKSTPTVDSQHWYVYHDQQVWTDQDFTTAKRIFGKHRVWFLYLHINKPTNLAYTAVYEVQTTKKTPAYLDHLVQLAGLFGITTPSLGGGGGAVTVFNAREFDIPYVPSDITFTPQLTVVTPPPTPGGANPVSFGTVGTAISGPVAETFDNEGKYWLDFSVAVPITKISQLQYTDANGTIVPAMVDKRNIFGLVNLYFKPIDVKGTGFSKWPHLVAGVAIDSTPLKNILVGVGYGPALANFYAGALLNTDRAPSGLACGATPSAGQAQGPLPHRTCAQFSFGLNLGVGAVVNALKGK